MEDNNEKKSKTVDELSNFLKEIYEVTKSKKLYRKDIKDKYGISQYALRDLMEADVKLLEVDTLKEIEKLLKNDVLVTKIGSKFGIGNYLVGCIRKELGMEQNRGGKTPHDRDSVKRYRTAQNIWKRVTEGEDIDDIAKNLQIDVGETNELLYSYYGFVNGLREVCQNYSKCRNINIKASMIKEYKEKYNLSDDVIEYIQFGTKNDNIEKAVEQYVKKQGFKRNDDGGEERE